MDNKKIIGISIAVIIGSFGLFYIGGVLAQLMKNYAVWQNSGGMGSNVAMGKIVWDAPVCLRNAFTLEGLKGMLGALMAGGAIFAYIKLHDKFDGKEQDPRGFTKSKTGAYGTASWMTDKEMKEVLEISTPSRAEGVILGEHTNACVVVMTA